MFKKRIKKWSLDRNKKHSDMIYALRLALEREVHETKTAFSIRGRLLIFEDVKHYFSRKGVRDLGAAVFEARNDPPTTRIDCHTPGPEDPRNALPVEKPKARASIVI